MQLGRGVEEEILREAFVEALTAQWQQQARAILASDNRVDNKELMRRLMEIARPARNLGDTMELGQLQVKLEEEGTNFKAAVVGNGGRIQMRAQFSNMQELLNVIRTALPGNDFLRQWLQDKVKEEPNRKRQKRIRVLAKDSREETKDLDVCREGLCTWKERAPSVSQGVILINERWGLRLLRRGYKKCRWKGVKQTQCKHLHSQNTQSIRRGASIFLFACREYTLLP